jgi:hypothetical protein
MTDSCSNAALDARKVIAACDGCLARIDARREKLKAQAIAYARKGFWNRHNRLKSDDEVYSGLASDERAIIEITGYQGYGQASALKQLAERVVSGGGLTVNVSAEDYSAIARYWPEDED